MPGNPDIPNGEPQEPKRVRVDTSDPRKKTVLVAQPFSYGHEGSLSREVCLTASEGVNTKGVITVEFMGQKFDLPDEDYVKFFPGALQLAIDKLKEK